jgi:lipopolysaccharide export system permease protein
MAPGDCIARGRRRIPLDFPMRLTWYIIRLHIGPFLFGTSAVVFIFLLQFIFKYLNDLVGKGLSYWVILQFIVYNMAWMLVLAVPMGVLVATLMAYGKLSGSNELTIIKSSGGSAFRAMFPSIVGGLLLFGALFYFNDKILPETNQRAYVLQSDIKQLKPSFAIDPGRFSTLQGFSILARQVDRDKNELYNVTIYNQDGDMLNVINAKRARMRFNRDFSKLLMTFYQGEIHQVNRRNQTQFRKLSFDEHQVAVPVEGFNFNRSDPSALGRTDRTMNIHSLDSIADSATVQSLRAEARMDTLLRNQIAETPHVSPLGTEPPISRSEAASNAMNRLATLRAQFESENVTRNEQIRQADQYMVEVHKKYSIPAACLVFVFVGAPLGILVRRGNFGVSASIALGFFIIYWSCLVSGEKLADRAILSPAVSMWMADAVIGAMGVYLTILVSRETVTFNFDFAWLRFFRRRRLAGETQGG